LTATLASGSSPGTATCAALTGWPTTTAVYFCIYTTDTSGNKVAGSQTDWVGVVSGSTITSLALKAGTNVGYSVGAIVEASPVASWADALVSGLLVEHNQNGTHGAVTATSVTSSAGVTIGGNLSVTGTLTGITPAKFQNPYKFSVYRSAAGSSAATGPVLYDTKSYDTGTNVDIVTNKGRFTAPVAGFYTFKASLGQTYGGTGNTFSIALYKNGTIIKQGMQKLSSAAETIIGQVTGDLQLSAADYIEVYNLGPSTTYTTGAAFTYFDGHLISAT
jgi:hypothetical protein